MTKLKITVLKLFAPEDILGPDHNLKFSSGKPLTKCTMFEEGQEFIVTDFTRMPEGFCGWAWNDFYKSICLMYFKADSLGSREGRTFVTCTDGKRPVVFKLERIE